MAANTTPIFTLTPVVAVATVSAANTARDGTGTIVAVLTGGTNGTRIEFITIKATVTTSAGAIAFYIDPGTGTFHLWTEVLVTAVTASTTVAAFQTELVRTDGLPVITLPATYRLGASTEIANNFRIIAHGGDY
jgi:hypothetical protein